MPRAGWARDPEALHQHGLGREGIAFSQVTANDLAPQLAGHQLARLGHANVIHHRHNKHLRRALRDQANRTGQRHWSPTGAHFGALPRLAVLGLPGS